MEMRRVFASQWFHACCTSVITHSSLFRFWKWSLCTINYLVTLILGLSDFSLNLIISLYHLLILGSLLSKLAMLCGIFYISQSVCARVCPCPCEGAGSCLEEGKYMISVLFLHVFSFFILKEKINLLQCDQMPEESPIKNK